MNLTELIFNIPGYDIYCTTNCTITTCCTSYCIISCIIKGQQDFTTKALAQILATVATQK